MGALSYTLAPPLGHRANLGLVVLRSDETLEADFRRVLPAEGVALYVTRIPSSTEVSSETLAAMEQHISGAAGLLPPRVAFDCIGYGCTSASALIGTEQVATLVRTGRMTRAVTDPLSALVAACRALGLRRLGLVTPYVATVSEGLRGALKGQGIATPVLASFEEAEETRVARIDAPSLAGAVRHVAGQGGVDAVFLSCTNLRTFDVIAPLEAELGLPVLSSNQVLIWHMFETAGIAERRSDLGALWTRYGLGAEVSPHGCDSL
ncbi:aspartate/glutamate racemase family protein [Cognatishimia sp. F0-27]|uniref:maleate cis-trans isomerase family protein n=1 Tax=Cognatishimia sp. F0-27 TaxID=2816855 RepID=UPI001D0CDB96|nr:aspartate/glutamate racemase family protein [Cognatishimia sp. F0-27]MCC1493384.1 aspartate/glutamate racemase family protein [Cognatishimia sp. F0-27]